MDNHSTTRVDPRVLDAMLPFFTEEYGNAASRSHAFGWRAEEHVERARTEIARLIGAEAREIVFTSGATESDNLALLGAARGYREKGRHLVTCAIEHKAVLDPCKHLESEGFRVTIVGVDASGRIDPGAVEAAISDDTIAVSVMAANNEIGVLQPIDEIGALCRARGVLFHSDAAQAAGRIPLDVNASSIDLMSLSAHKMYGPKGVGALFVRRKRPRVRLEPIIWGGGHEHGMRSGTLNVPAIVGFGVAARIAREEMIAEATATRILRDRLLARLREAIPEVRVNGDLEHRLPNNLNISFPYVEGESLLMALSRQVAVSSGSACTSATLEPSYVLRALGVADDVAHSSLRFGLGRFNTEEEVDRVAQLVIENVGRLREMSPRYHDRARSRPVENRAPATAGVHEPGGSPR